MPFRERAGRWRAGHSLIELIVVMAALSVIAVATANSLAAVSRIGRAMGDRAERLAAARTVVTLLGWETADLVPGSDALGLSGDSVTLRAFRGRGIVCSAGPPTLLSFRGLRLPDPAKDSLLVLAGSRPERVIALSGSHASAGACPAVPGEQIIAVPDTGLALRDVVLFFERGAYHLANGALRYRRGPGGRQPVTADVLDPDSTRFGLVRASTPSGPIDSAGFEIRIAADPVPPAGLPLPWRVRIPFRNAALPLDSAT